MTKLVIANWNVEWATSRSQRGKAINAILSKESPDLVCLTEANSSFFDSEHVIEASVDYGYEQDGDRRKVILGSNRPWSNVTRGEDLALPPGRFVAGTTDTAFGPVHVIGVCIPWRDAHVRTGRRDRRPWEEHLLFLKGLEPYLADRTGRTIVVGDFNQRLPRRRQPAEVHEALMRCFGPHWKVATEGLTDAADPTLLITSWSAMSFAPIYRASCPLRTERA
ncbi:endonuclease/exonuclease/phosphatase family protein [Sphingomicrobium sp. XHP0239]|uniref:endonuclease/exonuclease/phosphatase family protein n=1 Tax=Sphingomicrobium maritimum TaxID=3133972 RepID=UPI0031CC4D79